MPAVAQTQTPTQFVAEFSVPSEGEELLAERGDPLLTVTMRPELVVELTAVPDEQTQRDIGISGDSLLEIGTRLYGSSNRRSLYCHTITDRLVGSSGTCFRDFNNDSAFEQGVKLEAPSLDTDVVILASNGEWHGGTFVDRERLEPPLTYRAVPDEDVQTYPARVTWYASARRPDPSDYPVIVSFGITAGESRGSDVLGNCTVQITYSGSPVSAKFYGNTINVLGFTEGGDMRYTVEANADPVTIQLIYQFETRNPYVALALARDQRNLPCAAEDVASLSEDPGD